MEEKNRKPPLKNYLRYSGLGFQIAGALALGAFIGNVIDKKMQNHSPYFTLGFAMVFLFAGMYLAFKDLLKKE